MKKYYNIHEINQILSLIETDPYEAKIRFEEYLRKYTKDYTTYAQYSFLLIRIGLFEEARVIIDKVKKLTNDNKHYKDSTGYFKTYIINAELKLLSYQEKYEELYKFYIENSKEINTTNSNIIIFNCFKKTGKLNSENKNKYNYLKRQILEYDINDFYVHIQKHLADPNKNLDKPNKCIFLPNFPINEILEEAKKYIPSDKVLFTGEITDEYTFKYDGCGKVNNKTVDYFKIICFHNTKNYITIFPSQEGEKLPHIDLNYMNKNIKEETKTKRLSQIDKFNQRYKIK